MTLPAFPELRFVGRQRLYSYLTPEEIEGSDGAEKIRLDLEQYIIPLHLHNAAEENYLFEHYLDALSCTYIGKSSDEVRDMAKHNLDIIGGIYE